MPGRTRDVVDVPDALARLGPLRVTLDPASDALDVGERMRARDVSREVDHRLLALTERTGGHGRARVENELPCPGHVLAADEDRTVRKARVNRADQFVDVRPLLREHHRDGDRVGRRVDTLHDLGDAEAVVDQVRLRRRPTLERRFTEAIHRRDQVSCFEQRAG